MSMYHFAKDWNLSKFHIFNAIQILVYYIVSLFLCYENTAFCGEIAVGMVGCKSYYDYPRLLAPGEGNESLG